jgi:SAM-dependent MidA family methyltransferase
MTARAMTTQAKTTQTMTARATMSQAMTPLEAEIRGMIATDGPMTVARYMALCAAHPRHGYYMTRDPFGTHGDFVTAPEISQMFGELIGLWAASVWRMMGAPDPVQLVELGPGRGTLMSDALRAAKIVPAFRNALQVDLVEVSPVLRRRQEATLADAGVACTWHGDLAEVPDGPAIFIANEFFDALPVHQAAMTPDGWHERMVGFDGKLMFALHPARLPFDFGTERPHLIGAAPLGAVYEWRDEIVERVLARRVARQGGAALIIDYGHLRSSIGETLQAVASHGFADPLDTPGEADLTAHVDFQALAEVAKRYGTNVQGPIFQGTLLQRLGIEQRAARLKPNATAEQAAAIDGARLRLTGNRPGQMGELFKAMVIADPKLPELPGFEIAGATREH